jgi:glycosyltransferase involved in cell wall biosynthesis
MKKYDIISDFLLVPNQLWVHKNHKTVLYAVKNLAKEGSPIQIIFTGKEDDYRFPNYPSEIRQLVKELGIQKQAKFIGFIPKDELENLILAAKAIIQPSLFEGWSTVIEEAKRYNKFIIASDIPIHLEQLENYPNKDFFLKTDPLNLAEKLKALTNSEINVQEYNYDRDIEIFCQKFLNIFSD